MESNLAKRLKKEALEARLVQHKKDYKALECDYQEASDSDEKNRLQRKLNHKIEEIENTQKELQQTEQSEQTEKKQRLIYILNYYFDQELNYLQKAYEISLPERFINRKLPEKSEGLLSKFQLTNPQEAGYSCLEKFLGHLWLLSQNLCGTIKDDLTTWIKENINNYQDLMTQLEQENQEQKKKSHPCLLVVINSQSSNKYALTVWFINNYNYKSKPSNSDFKQITWKDKNNVERHEFLTNQNLSQFPKIIEYCINKIFQQYNLQKILQLQIFLPICLMKHKTDCCQIDDYIIGKKHEIIIRCSERIKATSISSQNSIITWQEKGKKIVEKLENSAGSVFIPSDEPADYNSFDDRLQNDDTLIGVYFTNCLNETKYHSLLFKGGIPLALWIRQELDHINIKQELSDILKTNDQEILLKDLPKQVMRERGKGKKISEHLCLLWDDPNFLPPTQNTRGLTRKQI